MCAQRTAAAVSATPAETVLSTKPAAAGSDAELIAACGAFVALERQRNALNREVTGDAERLADVEDDRLYNEQDPHFDRILATRATTVAGMRAKARALAAEDLELLKSGTGPRNECLMASIVADLISNEPIASPASPDAALIGDCDRLIALEKEAAREADRLADASDEDWHDVIDPIWDKRDQVVDRIVSMRATTPAGVLALITALETHNPVDPKLGDRGFSFEGGMSGRLLETALRSAKAIRGAAAPPFNPDADLISLCEQIVQSEAEWNSTGLHQDTLPQAEQHDYEQTVREPISDRSSELFDRLLQMTPQTLEGQRAAARATVAFMPCYPDGTPDIEINHIAGNMAWKLVKQLAGVAVPLPHTASENGT